MVLHWPMLIVLHAIGMGASATGPRRGDSDGKPSKDFRSKEIPQCPASRAGNSRFAALEHSRELHCPDGW
jgi:hypothetical protein